MTTLNELLEVDQSGKHLVHNLLLGFELFCFDAGTASTSCSNQSLIHEQVFDHWTQLQQFLVDGVHEKRELLLNLLLIGRLSNNLPGLCVPQIEELFDYGHFLDPLPLQHVGSGPRKCWNRAVTLLRWSSCCCIWILVVRLGLTLGVCRGLVDLICSHTVTFVVVAIGSRGDLLRLKAVIVLEHLARVKRVAERLLRIVHGHLNKLKLIHF